MEGTNVMMMSDLIQFIMRPEACPIDIDFGNNKSDVYVGMID